MKYSEFETIAKENGWEFDNSYNLSLYAYKLGIGIRVAISKTTSRDLSIATDDGYCSIFKEEEFIEACYELAKTPLEDREEPKKYYLKHKFLGCDMYGRYLNIDFKDGVYFIASKETYVGEYQTAFTKLEIEEIKSRYGVTLEDFESEERGRI